MPVRVAACAALVAVLALLASFVWMAVSAGVGLLVLSGLGFMGFALVRSIPLFAQKIENRILAGRKSEARENPIEQLQNFLIQKKRRVDEFRSAVTTIGAQIKSLSDMVEDRKKKKPGYDASKQERSILAMKEAHQRLVQKYESALSATEQLAEIIEEKKFEWQFGNAGQAAIRSLNASSGQELLDEMLADEAFSSVRDNFNHVFAELEIEASRLHEGKALEFDNGMTIDLSAIELPAPIATPIRR